MSDEERVSAEEAAAQELESKEEAPAAKEVEQSHYSAAEDKARAGGWVSKGEWVEQGNDEEDHRSAREFNERGELFRKISNQSKALKQTKETLNTLAAHHQKVAEYERDKVLGELKQQKIAALQDDDHARVVDIDEEIQNVKSSTIDVPQVDNSDPDVADAELAAQEWVSRNQWYETNPVLQKEANMAMAGYRAVNTDATPDEIFDYASKQVRKTNPEHFRSNDTASSKVSGGRTGGGQGGGKTMPSMSDLDFDTQKTVKSMCAMTDMSEQKYIEELVKTGAIAWD